MSRRQSAPLARSVVDAVLTFLSFVFNKESDPELTYFSNGYFTRWSSSSNKDRGTITSLQLIHVCIIMCAKLAKLITRAPFHTQLLKISSRVEFHGTHKRVLWYGQTIVGSQRFESIIYEVGSNNLISRGRCFTEMWTTTILRHRTINRGDFNCINTEKLISFHITLKCIIVITIIDSDTS